MTSRLIFRFRPPEWKLLLMRSFQNTGVGIGREVMEKSQVQVDWEKIRNLLTLLFTHHGTGWLRWFYWFKRRKRCSELKIITHRVTPLFSTEENGNTIRGQMFGTGAADAPELTGNHEVSTTPPPPSPHSTLFFSEHPRSIAHSSGEYPLCLHQIHNCDSRSYKFCLAFSKKIPLF